MNISLAAAAEKKAKKSKTGGGGGLSFGLNSRKTKSKNVFGGDDDDDDSDHNNSDDDGGRKRRGKTNTKASVRDEVNRDLAAEQAALRKRASTAVYDFDGTYQEREDPSKKKKQQNNSEEDGKRESRYIANLMKTAKRRNYERDLVFERKMAKEQAQEEAENVDFMGKEKFITSAYKRKLAERQEWAKQDEEAQKKEDEEDVTKRKGGLAFASFYNNMARGPTLEKKKDGNKGKTDPGKDAREERNRSGSRDGDSGAEQPSSENRSRQYDSRNDHGQKHDFMDGFEPATETGRDKDHSVDAQGNEDHGSSAPSKSVRQLRMEKIVAARASYFERHPQRQQMKQ